MSGPIRDGEVAVDTLLSLIAVCRIESEGPRSLELVMSPALALVLTNMHSTEHPYIGLLAYADGIVVRTVHGIPVMVDWDLEGDSWYATNMEKEQYD